MKIATRFLFAAALASAPLASAGCSRSSSSTPPADDAGDTADAGFDASDGALSYDFSALKDYLFGGSWKTDGVVVLHNGQIVFEQYANGYGAAKRHITYSASKSVGSALIGIAVGEGLLKLTDSVCKYVPATSGADPTLCDTTIENLLQMSSGLSWNENYSDPATSTVLSMLYGNVSDMGLYVAGMPRAAKAGTVWNYSSGDANLLAKALHTVIGGQDMHAWAKQKLFDPAGLTSAIFETDRAGTLVFSSSCFMTPRDMARFGQLYLNGGSIDGKKVLPDGWVDYSIKPAAAVSQPSPRLADAGPGDTGGSYGAAWWLNAATKSATQDTWLYPEAPVDAYAAEGHWGQKVFVVPSRKLVIARTGNDRDPVFNSGPMVGKAVQAIDAAGGK